MYSQMRQNKGLEASRAYDRREFTNAIEVEFACA